MKAFPGTLKAFRIYNVGTRNGHILFLLVDGMRAPRASLNFTYLLSLSLPEGKYCVFGA
jgi:hypothetical protein